jgi:hypothetical protein
VNAVCGKGEAVRDRSDALAPRALGLQCGLRPRADQAALVLRRTVDDGAHEPIRRRVAVAGAGGGDDARAFALGGALDSHGERDVARDAVALRDDENARAAPAYAPKRRGESRTLVDRRNAAHAVVRMPRGNSHARARGPYCDSGALGIGTEALLVLAHSDVGHGDEGVSWLSAFDHGVHCVERDPHGTGSRQRSRRNPHAPAQRVRSRRMTGTGDTTATASSDLRLTRFSESRLASRAHHSGDVSQPQGVGESSVLRWCHPSLGAWPRYRREHRPGRRSLRSPVRTPKPTRDTLDRRRLSRRQLLGQGRDVARFDGQSHGDRWKIITESTPHRR